MRLWRDAGLARAEIVLRRAARRGPKQELAEDEEIGELPVKTLRADDEARPHQGIGQKTPVDRKRPTTGCVVSAPVLGGLHHEYRRAA